MSYLTAETAPTLFIEASNNVRFAYRRLGNADTDKVPVVLHIHFRGNMDLWDPLLINEIAKSREVILFDNAGVGKSNGEVPDTYVGWAKDLVSFIEALGLRQVDLLGFSMGGIAVLEAALLAPHLVRKLIIAGSRASISSNGAVSGIVWPQDQPDSKYFTALASAVTFAEGRDALKYSFFPATIKAEAAFDEYWSRLQTRSIETPTLDLLPMGQGGSQQVAAVLEVEVPRPGSSFDRLGELQMPVLILNGDDDLLIPTSRSWELLKQIENAQLIIYPRSGHGFLWQYPVRVGQDVDRFLGGADF